VREKLLFQAYEENEGKLEPFAVVDGHEFDRGKGALIICGGSERELFEEEGQ
jgi:hypothetical protein